jgi:PAS domain S-box-containing protein
MMQRNDGALLRESLESMWVAIFIATPEGKIMDVNRSACALLGYAKEELLSMGMADIISAETAEHLERAAREQIIGEEVSIESKGIHTRGGAYSGSTRQHRDKDRRREDGCHNDEGFKQLKRSDEPCHTGR